MKICQILGIVLAWMLTTGISNAESFSHEAFAVASIQWQIFPHASASLSHELPTDSGSYLLDSTNLMIMALLLSLLATAYSLRSNIRLRKTTKNLTESNNRLREKESRYRLLTDNSSFIIWTMNLEGRFIYISPAVEQLRGYPAREAMAQGLEESFTSISAHAVRVAIRHLLQHGTLQQERWEMEQPCRDGSIIWTEATVTVIRDESGAPVALEGISRDITAQKHTLDVLKARSIALEAAADGVVITDRNGFIEYVNPAYTRNTGFTLNEAIGQRPSIVRSGMQSQHFYHAMWQTILAGKVWKGELINRHKDGTLFNEEMAISPVTNNNGEVVRFVAIKRDITERKKLEENLTLIAHYDRLTALPNRELFYERLKQIFMQASRHQYRFAVLFIDLDGFKAVNDNYGHKTGDRVLQEVARRLSKGTRCSDTVARMGGDEFVVILPRINNAQNASHIARKILSQFKTSFVIEEHECRITASIGISLFPDDGEDTENLLNNADAAMYLSKKRGKNTYCYFKEVFPS